jgi:hypothetical protein
MSLDDSNLDTKSIYVVHRETVNSENNVQLNQPVALSVLKIHAAPNSAEIIYIKPTA